MQSDNLRQYRSKRNFRKTPEPTGRTKRSPSRRLRFVVQKHEASRLHYDLRLEVDGVFKSWAITKGPSLDPDNKRLAVEVEDHPLDYGDFEGIIPADQYGGGTVLIWDRGYWEPQGGEPAELLAKGNLKFLLRGERLNGGFVLVRMRADKRRGNQSNWLLIKHGDTYARKGYGDTILDESSFSITSGRTMEQIASGAPSTLRRSKSRQSDIVLNRSMGHPSCDKDHRALPEPNHSVSSLAKLPAFVKMQLCESRQRPPTGVDWIHEIKFDGYRMQLRNLASNVTLRTRSGLDWSRRFPEICNLASVLPDCVLDGEICALDDNGNPDFGALQAAISEHKLAHSPTSPLISCLTPNPTSARAH